MRAFIAIGLPKEIKKSLADLQENLKTSGSDVKWVLPENIHLTLKFLGEIDDEEINQINPVLDDIAKDKKAFSISLSSLGAFPKISSPRVIWVGIKDGENQVQEIAQGLEQRLAKIGIPRETREFSTHITIGRVRSPLNRGKLTEALQGLKDSLTSENLFFPANRITLFKSTLTPSGPVYEAIKEASLAIT